MSEETKTKTSAAKKAAKKAATKSATPAPEKAVAKKAAKSKVKAVEVVVEAPAPAPAPVEAPQAEAKPAKKAAAKKAAVSKRKAPVEESTPAAEVPAPVIALPPPIPEPPPIPDFLPSAEDLTPPPVAPAPSPAPHERDRRDRRHDNNQRGPKPQHNKPRDTREAPQQAPGAEDGQPQDGDNSDPNSQKGRLSRRQRWREKLRQKYLARMAARGEPIPEGEAPPATEGGDRPDRAERPAPAPEPLGPPEPVEGILELTPKGYGFLRLREKLYAPLNSDCWVSGDLIRKYGLREGMGIKGTQCQGPRGPQLTEIAEVNGRKPEEMKDLPLFEELKATNPVKRYQLETRPDRYTTRIIDMLTPVGRGQRGLIVAPPRAGKTTLLQHIAEAMTENYPQVHLMLLLVDERPEEVTEFRRVLPNAEIYASSNDQDVKSHTRIAQFAIERAKRLVEQGDHVFILMDSITRLARAFNNAKSGGATMSGGMGVGAMEIPRRLFAAARNTKTAGSLTILATALIETGSKMDDLIFQEFKGTGNMELVLDRKIAEQYIYPAVNIFKSGTRREELLLQTFQIEKIHFLRRGLSGHKPIEAIQRVLSLMERQPNNSQMLVELSSKQA